MLTCHVFVMYILAVESLWRSLIVPPRKSGAQMRASSFVHLAALVFVVGGARMQAQQAPLTPNQQAARDIYKELLETNTSVMTAGTTVAAQEIAKRYRDAGFA